MLLAVTATSTRAAKHGNALANLIGTSAICMLSYSRTLSRMNSGVSNTTKLSNGPPPPNNSNATCAAAPHPLAPATIPHTLRYPTTPLDHTLAPIPMRTHPLLPKTFPTRPTAQAIASPTTIQHTAYGCETRLRPTTVAIISWTPPATSKRNTLDPKFRENPSTHVSPPQ